MNKLELVFSLLSKIFDILNQQQISNDWLCTLEIMLNVRFNFSTF